MKKKEVKKVPLILTDGEKALFIDELFKLYKAHPDLTMYKLIPMARLCLPEGRRFGEQISSLHAMAWMKKMWEARLAKEAEKEKLSARPIPAPNGAPVPPVPSSPASSDLAPQKKQRKEMVRYSREEQMIFAEAFWKAKTSGFGTYVACFAEANKAMPPNRQQKEGNNKPTWFEPTLEIVRKRKEAEGDAKREAEEVPTSDAVVEVAAASPLTSMPNLSSVPTALPVVDLNALLFNALVGGIQAAMQNILQSGQLQDSIKNMLLPQGEQPALQQENRAAQEDKRPKVMVVGLLGVQSEDVAKEFSPYFKFKFFNSETHHKQLRDAAKFVDHAFLMTQFVSHSTQNVLRSHPNFTFCNGNSSALKMLLKEKIGH